jgi:hypothetical protein
MRERERERAHTVINDSIKSSTLVLANHSVQWIRKFTTIRCHVNLSHHASSIQHVSACLSFYIRQAVVEIGTHTDTGK